MPTNIMYEFGYLRLILKATVAAFMLNFKKLFRVM